MAKYRNNLPLMSNDIFLTDGGLETTLVFHEGMDLPAFAAFVLLETDEGRKTLTDYFQKYIAIAKEQGTGFVLESPTWRANFDWGNTLGYSKEALETINRDAIRLLNDIRNGHETDRTRMVISGCIGPRGDGYVIGEKMTAEEAAKYHAPQITTFSNTAADLVSAYTISYTEEAIGIVRAAESEAMPVVIGFTLETDGKLPSGQALKDAIEAVDAATDNFTSYYMINCAHPTHFQDVLGDDGFWKQRIQAVRANASTKSHAELDEAEELDAGNPPDFEHQYKALRSQLKNLNVLGGCCGTDHRHIEAICKSFII